MTRSARLCVKKIIAVLTVFALFAILLPVFSENVRVQAAEKKTVRVSTGKQLKKALKDSTVGTIVLRTETVDPITITSKKAKKKNLIVDAPNATVTNNAKFKTVTVENATKYTENVSGNKITLKTSTGFEIASGKSVKKLTFLDVSPWETLRYVVREGASIGTVAFEDDGRVTDLGNNSFRIVKSVYTDEDMNTADYRIELVFDKDGRITGETVDRIPSDEDEDSHRVYSYEYDNKGNLSKLVNSSPVYEYDIYVETFYYDDNNNLTGYSVEYDDRPVCGYDYEYDDSGKMISCVYYDEISGSKTTCSYDKNGRLSKEKNTYYSFVYGENGFEQEVTRSWTTKTKYTKNGCELKVTYDWGDGADAVKSVVTYEYDDNGNRISYRSEDYYDKDDSSNKNVYRNEFEYDDLGRLLNSYYIDDDGRRVNMADIAG